MKFLFSGAIALRGLPAASDARAYSLRFFLRSIILCGTPIGVHGLILFN